MFDRDTLGSVVIGWQGSGVSLHVEVVILLMGNFVCVRGVGMCLQARSVRVELAVSTRWSRDLLPTWNVLLAGSFVWCGCVCGRGRSALNWPFLFDGHMTFALRGLVV